MDDRTVEIEIEVAVDAGEQADAEPASAAVDGDPLADADGGPVADERAEPPEPELPAWARDDVPVAPSVADEPADDGAGDEVVEVTGAASGDDATTGPDGVDPEDESDPEDEDEVGDDAVGDPVPARPEGVVSRAVESVSVPGVVVIDDDTPAPTVPAWALDAEPGDDPTVVEADGATAPADEDPSAPDEPSPTADDEVPAEMVEVDDDAEAEADGADPEAEEPARPAEAVDVSVLEQLETELGEVEEALAAIDAGDLDRSPLLNRLLAEPRD